MKTILLGVIAMMSVTSIYAQQEAMFTHYAFNTLAVNPGYAGSRDALTVTTLHRSQWVGFDGAPTTQTLNVHSPIHNDKLGVGLSILNDKIGPISTFSIFADFACTFQKSPFALIILEIAQGLLISHPKAFALFPMHLFAFPIY